MSALGVETLLAKRWDATVHDFSQSNIAVTSFSIISVVFSLMILAKLAHQAKTGGGMKSYDYLFILLQLFNFATQGIVIYCQTVSMMSNWAENLLQYLAAASILGVVFVNVQTLTLFAVLDLRITRTRIQMIAVTFVILFFLLTTLELRNVFVAGSVNRSSESEIRLHQTGTILVILFAAIGLLYDNVQGWLLFYLLDQSRSEKQKVTFQKNAIQCPMVRMAVHINALGVAIDWIGIGLAITYATSNDPSQYTYLAAATVTSGIHSSWCVINFNILKYSALMTSSSPTSWKKKNEPTSKQKSKMTCKPAASNLASPPDPSSGPSLQNPGSPSPLPVVIGEMETQKMVM